MRRPEISSGWALPGGVHLGRFAALRCSQRRPCFSHMALSRAAAVPFVLILVVVTRVSVSWEIDFEAARLVEVGFADWRAVCRPLRRRALVLQLAAQIEKAEPWNKKRPPVYD